MQTFIRSIWIDRRIPFFSTSFYSRQPHTVWLKLSPMCGWKLNFSWGDAHKHLVCCCTDEKFNWLLEFMTADQRCTTTIARWRATMKCLMSNIQPQSEADVKLFSLSLSLVDVLSDSIDFITISMAAKFIPLKIFSSSFRNLNEECECGDVKIRSIHYFQWNIQCYIRLKKENNLDWNRIRHEEFINLIGFWNVWCRRFHICVFVFFVWLCMCSSWKTYFEGRGKNHDPLNRSHQNEQAHVSLFWAMFCHLIESQ